MPAADDASARVAVRPDLRLLPAAVGAEAGALAGLLLPGRAVAVGVVLALVGASAVRLAAPRARTTAAVLALLLVTAGSLAGAGLRAEQRRTGPVAEAASAGRFASVEVVLTGDPVPTRSGVSGDALRRASVTVQARLERLTVGGRSVTVRTPVLLVAPADGWSRLLPSQRIRTDGELVRPRGPDLAAVVLVRGPPELQGGPSRWQTAAGSLRTGLRNASAGLPGEARGLLPGLVDGDTSGLDPQLRDDARAAGLSHLTAVSGANCAIVLALVLALVRPTPLGRRGRAALAVVGLAGFVLLARPSPSVLRAALMGGIALLALALGRRRAALPALLGAATLLVLADPDLASAPGFLLSVAATGSLLVLAPTWAEALGRRLPRWAAHGLAVPLAASVAVTPLVVLLSGSISLAAVPANLLAAPAVPVATVLGVLVAGVAPVAPGPAAVLATVAGWPCRWIALVAHRCAHLPWATVPWPQTAAGAVLAGLVVLAAVAAVRRRRSRRLLVAGLVGVVLAALLVPRTVATWPGHDWRLIACDVGQGDALLVRGSADALPVLVDAGPEPAALSACLRDVGVTRLAAVVLSHLHADHVEGLPAVLGQVPTAAVFVNPLDEPALEGKRVRGWAARASVPVTVLVAGERMTAGGVVFDVLGPTRVLHGTNSDPNNDSLVLLARAGGLRVLLTGDVEPEGQAGLLARGVPHVDVLKIPHHGSSHQDDRFLGATGARVAIASAGRGNAYGHPAPSTLTTVARDGMLPMRTDTDGGVAIAPSTSGPRVLPQKASHRPALAAAPRMRSAPDATLVGTDAGGPASAGEAAGAEPSFELWCVGPAPALRPAPEPRARPPPAHRQARRRERSPAAGGSACRPRRPRPAPLR